MLFSKKMRWLPLFTSVCVLWQSPCSQAQSIPKKYERQIEQSVKRWWPDLPKPKLWAAQIQAESAFRPEVCSHVNACGLSQFLEPTWRDTERALGWPSGSSRIDPYLAIEAGAYYQAKMRKSWRPEGRSPYQRNDLGLCAYNRGLGNCIKDQAECGGALLWEHISPCTARHTMETVDYVARINRYWKKFELE